MKISGYVLILLMVGFCFALVGSVVNDLETQYPEVDINSSWEDQYNFADEINESASSLKEQFDIIGDEDVGWFSKIAAGIYAIPKAVIFIPSILFQIVSYGVEVTTSLGSQIGIPEFVLYMGGIAIIVIVIFAVTSFWHRSKA